MVHFRDLFRQSNESDISDVQQHEPEIRNSVKMIAELDNGTAQWIFDNPRLDTVFGECNMTGEQQAAASTASGAQAPPFTAQRQGFLGVHEGPAS